MKNYVLTGLVAAHSLLAAQPAAAAGFDEMRIVQSGTFTGARIRISLGGGNHHRKVRAGFTIAPMFRSQAISGEARTRFGKGVELGFAGERPLTLSIGGRPVGRSLSDGRKLEKEQRLGISTGGYVAIGVSAAALVGAFLLYDHYRDADAVSD